MYTFKKIASVLASTAMMTSTVALAAAANYPAPFVSGITSDIAIVYGSTGLPSDLLAASTIQGDLATALAGNTATPGTTTPGTVSGEAYALFTSSNKIYLNDSLSKAKSVVTKTELPGVLADGTFEGDVSTTFQQRIDINAPVKANIQKVAKALGKAVNEITVVVLDRERHQDLMNQIRKVGARVRTITDGDVAGAIAPCLPDSGIDLLMGIGASTEAVLAAAAVKILGGEIYCRFAPKDDKQLQLIKKAGFRSLQKVYSSEDLARGRQLTFTATGVIDGPLLPGVIFRETDILTHSIVMRASSGTIRYVTTRHHIR